MLNLTSMRQRMSPDLAGLAAIPTEPIPLSVLTGFLGSGKTTFLSKVLAVPDLRDTAVIISEFGAVALDHLLLEAAVDDVVELPNGCTCCAVRQGLADSFYRLLRSRQAIAGRPPFRRIALETSGLADPGPTLYTLSADAFLEASRLLITPTLSNALRYARPPDGIRHYRFPVSTWKHFERLPHLPRGVLPVADSFCRFNPVHAQGMSSAAKQARVLQDVLSQAVAEPDPIAAVQAQFMAQVASVLETPWIMSTSADLAFPQTRGERPDNFAEAREFEAALFRAAVADPIVQRAVTEVAQLLEPHQRLHEPDIMRRIEAVSRKAAA